MKLRNLIVSLFLAVIVFACNEKPAEQLICGCLNPSDFETTVNGKETALYEMKNGEITMAVTNYGGRIVSLLVPGNNGEMADVVLGFSSIDALECKRSLSRSFNRACWKSHSKGEILLKWCGLYVAD